MYLNNDKNAAKFGHSVPGTLENHVTTTIALPSSSLQPTTDYEVFSHIIKSSMGDTLLTTHSTSTLSTTTNFAIYIIVAACGGVAVLLFVVILLCMVLVYCAMTNKATQPISNKDIQDQGLV